MFNGPLSQLHNAPESNADHVDPCRSIAVATTDAMPGSAGRKLGWKSGHGGHPAAAGKRQRQLEPAPQDGRSPRFFIFCILQYSASG